MTSGKKLAKDILWNMVAFGVSGVLGIAVNIIIATYGDEKILGVYNQMMAFYIVIGQIASWGLQHSCVYFMANAKDDKEKNQRNSAMIVCVVIAGCLVAFLWYVFIKFGGQYIYRDAQMLKGLRAISLALTFFGINKCIAGIMNAYEKMVRYAWLQMLRYIIISVIILISVFTNSFYYFGIYCFLISEAVGLVVGLVFLSDLFRFTRPKIKYIRQCIRFGGRAMLGGIVTELNTKADVLVLGLFAPVEIVGVYSFTTILVEGCLSIVNVIKINLNPTFAKLIHSKRWEELAVYNKKLKLNGRLGAVLCMVIIVLGYVVVCNVFRLDAYLDAIVYLVILCTGISIACPQLLKGSLLTLSGKPHMDSVIAFVTVLINFILNFLFVPKFQCYGAAVATMLSYLAYTVIIEAVHRKQHVLAEIK